MMTYYFSYLQYSNYYDSTYRLKKKISTDIENDLLAIQNRFPDVKACWTNKSRLGCVFTDVEESKLGKY